MVSRSNRPTFEDPELQRRIMELRRVDNVTNLGYLALEYLTLAVILASAIVFAEYRATVGDLLEPGMSPSSAWRSCLSGGSSIDWRDSATSLRIIAS